MTAAKDDFEERATAFMAELKALCDKYDVAIGHELDGEPVGAGFAVIYDGRSDRERLIEPYENDQKEN